jgi:hypothetical protein
VVKLATDRATGQQWACKIMSLPPPGKQYNENESRWGRARVDGWVGHAAGAGASQRSSLDLC